MFLRLLLFTAFFFSGRVFAEIFPLYNTHSFSVVADGSEAKGLFDSMRAEPSPIPGFSPNDQRKKILIVNPEGQRVLALECYFIGDQNFYSCMLLFDKIYGLISTNWYPTKETARLETHNQAAAINLAKNFYLRSDGLIFESHDGSLLIEARLNSLGEVQSFHVGYAKL